MGEIKAGMYARSKNGEIGKIRVIKNDMIFLNENVYFHHASDLKTSDSLNDLITPGDYINGTKLLSIDYAEDSYGNCDKLHFYYSFENELADVNEYHERLTITSIVTKEQFESVEYEVGE